jgi:hypothetical protein
MRLLDMRARWDPSVAELLLDHARRFSSQKYEALALRTLGHPEQAGAIAEATGSDLLIGQLGAPGVRRAALDRIAAALPDDLRTPFVTGGRLYQPGPRTH